MYAFPKINASLVGPNAIVFYRVGEERASIFHEVRRVAVPYTCDQAKYGFWRKIVDMGGGLFQVRRFRLTPSTGSNSRSMS
jgi:hypothetical protein